MNSSMFANCSVFGDVREVRSSVFGQNHMFGHVRCSVFGDVREVQSSVFGQNHMFGHVRSSVLMILKNIGPIFY